ncbi:hypothetical protein Nepgr_009816 [Nepenthes gracilis]|uniref:Nucleolar complex protein 3 homolog n=1 Tax=Nepenthes gracilis TaxID=150966 RepID=A0AAD3SBU9_NEPGR|nr:hypothetical protein Nepgr_009816 [Nepenthes gracilis]
MGKKQKQNQKTLRPPDLPPEVPDEAIEVSDEDVQFVSENRNYARFVSGLDTQSITKHVSRVAVVKGDDLETLYEKRLRKNSVEKGEKGLEVDPVDALPVKTLDGKLYYRTGCFPNASKKSENEEKEDEVEGDRNKDDGDENAVRPTKVERRAKLKKSKKEAKKQAKEQAKAQEVQQSHQADVLAEVKKDLTAEEVSNNKKKRIAELGIALLADPEANIQSLKELLLFCKDEDNVIVKLALLSSFTVFRDIIPGYRIRLPTVKEKEMTVSKSVKKMRYYESNLLSSYKVYLQRLLNLEEQPLLHQVAVRCLCNLLDAVPHFNFRENILPAIVKNIGSSDDVVRKLCFTAIRSLFINEGKHGGEATVDAVRLIANHVRKHDCQLHPDSVEVFLSLSFDEDLGRLEKMDDNKKKKSKGRKNLREQDQSQTSNRKRSRQELISKTREEVSADFKAASFSQDITDRRRMQSETLSAVFETYFRILRHAVQSTLARAKGTGNLIGGTFATHPLLASCLKGVGRFSHLIDLDFMSDLMMHLKILASGGGGSDCSEGHLTVSERLQCCIVAFKVMRMNLDSLKVDLQDFFVQLYNLILEYRPGRDQGEVLSEALKIMLLEDRQHDMQRAAAFIKRLTTSSLYFGSSESMAALVTVKQLLQKNVKCQNMLENDPGGGSVSGSIVKYQPFSSDPHLSGALASVLWELNLLSKHYHPAVSTTASSIASMSSAGHNQVYLSSVTPQQAFMDLSVETESFIPKIDSKKLSRKCKRGTTTSIFASNGSALDVTKLVDEETLKKKLSVHFKFLRDIKEQERLQHELDRTTLSLKMYKGHYRKLRKGPMIMLGMLAWNSGKMSTIKFSFRPIFIASPWRSGLLTGSVMLLTQLEPLFADSQTEATACTVFAKICSNVEVNVVFPVSVYLVIGVDSDSGEESMVDVGEGEFARHYQSWVRPKRKEKLKANILPLDKHSLVVDVSDRGGPLPGMDDLSGDGGLSHECTVLEGLKLVWMFWWKTTRPLLFLVDRLILCLLTPLSRLSWSAPSLSESPSRKWKLFFMI